LDQRVLGIPFKRAPQRAIDYLEREEIDSILKAIDRTTPKEVATTLFWRPCLIPEPVCRRSPICAPATSS